MAVEERIDAASLGAPGVGQAVAASRPLSGLLPSRALFLQIARWFAVSFAFFVFSMPLLYVFYERVGLPFPVASLVAGEISTLLRFLANDRIVFRARRPTWKRLWQFHLVVAGSFTLWWIVSNAATLAGLHYLLASVVGAATTVAWSLPTNFFWIWRKLRAP